MSKKSIFYLLFFVVLIGVFYVVIRKWIVPNDTISVVQPFSFTDQDGNRLTNQDMDGKVYVAEFFYTTCTGVCPRMNTNMQLVYDRFKGKPDFRILSFTCKPEVDSSPVLREYADDHKIDTRSWIFLTGPKDKLYEAARLSYKVDDPLNNVGADEDFLHTQLWALVNKQGKVKAIYDGLKKSEVNEMIRKIDSMLD